MGKDMESEKKIMEVCHRGKEGGRKSWRRRRRRRRKSGEYLRERKEGE